MIILLFLCIVKQYEQFKTYGYEKDYHRPYSTIDNGN